MAFDLLICYQKEVNETVPTNCSVKTNSTLFKLCLASLEDDIYNNYMIFYGQIFMICEFYNGTRPMISAEKMFQVSFSDTVKILNILYFATELEGVVRQDME